jgi:hypothetical protein
MAVLIECLTLVVRKFDLDVRYPGGTDTFLNACLEVPEPPRFICNLDEHLVNLSFYSPEHLEPCWQLLVDNGFTDVEDNRFLDMAYIDQHHGPTMPCDWLEWRRHQDGFTLAWLAGTEPGDMAAPEEWTPAQSLDCKRSDIRDDPDRALKLGEEDGIETWLDLNTGRLVAGLSDGRERTAPAVAAAGAQGSAEPVPAEASAGPPDQPGGEPSGSEDELDLDAIIRELDLEFEREGRARAIVDSVVSRLDENGWSYERAGEWNLRFNLEGENAVYSTFVSVNPHNQVLTCLMSPALRVPARRRAAVCELLTRVNWTTALATLEMDLSDGEVRARTAFGMAGGTLVPKMVDSLIAAAFGLYERHFAALAKVAYTGAAPEEALGSGGG